MKIGLLVLGLLPFLCVIASAAEYPQQVESAKNVTLYTQDPSGFRYPTYINVFNNTTGIWAQQYQVDWHRNDTGWQNQQHWGPTVIVSSTPNARNLSLGGVNNTIYVLFENSTGKYGIPAYRFNSGPSPASWAAGAMQSWLFGKTMAFGSAEFSKAQKNHPGMWNASSLPCDCDNCGKSPLIKTECQRRGLTETGGFSVDGSFNMETGK